MAHFIVKVQLVVKANDASEAEEIAGTFIREYSAIESEQAKYDKHIDPMTILDWRFGPNCPTCGPDTWAVKIDEANYTEGSAFDE